MKQVNRGIRNVCAGVPADAGSGACKLKFFQYVEWLDGDECHFWRGRRFPSGYGAFFWRGKSYGAHIVAYYMKFREVPTVAMHMCSNKHCVNPDHIFNGTHSLNLRHRIHVEKAEK